ncbi:sigma-70 family RNA polymerase sigma factor [Paenibacillaceae bacterium]|nr:sigma-70 family RNA polymerase sigma factor [Paenibacillaceae bacterium]
MKEWCYDLYQFAELHPELQSSVYDSYYKFVYRDIFYLLKDHPLTEDMIQEAFFKILSSIKKHRVDNMLPWIRQVSRNVALDYLRKTKKERYTVNVDHVNLSEEVLVSATSLLQLEDEVEDKIRNELLHQAITELRPDYRELITLFYIEEGSYKELGNELGLSEYAVSQKLYRARKKLLKQFHKKWVNKEWNERTT